MTFKVGVVPGYEGVIQPSGFIPPGKTKGRLQIYNMKDPDPTRTEYNIASNDASSLFIEYIGD